MPSSLVARVQGHSGRLGRFRSKFVKVYPNEYRRALKELAAAKQEQKEIA